MTDTSHKTAVPGLMANYLRRCSSGGMPMKRIKDVQAAVDDADSIGYFDNMPAPLYIPEIGDEVMLWADWTFDLYDERRNSDVWKALDCASHPAAVEFMQWQNDTNTQMRAIEQTMILKPNPYYGRNSWAPQTIRDFRTEEDRAAYGELRDTLHRRELAVPVTMPMYTRLRVDRIYIRKGNSGFSSLTFYVTHSPLEALRPTEFKKKVGTGGRRRFWAKLSDVQKAVVQRVAPPEENADA
jgi:hypothetical protein